MALRILLLADISSSHTEKWALGLADKGYQVGIFSLNKSARAWFYKSDNIEVVHEGATTIRNSFLSNKLKYLLALPALWKVIKEFNPDLLHAHYATSYGLLGALSGFRPLVISAWGSDVYEFPKKSFIHKAILKFNLRAADKILSTSYVMKGELWKYSSKEVDVIPFGVNTTVFSPKNIKTNSEKDILHIGTIKAMEDKYGIKTIIDAVELVNCCLPETPIKVYLVGEGSRSNYYKKLVSSKNLEEIIVFTGKISFSHISNYHNLLDILLNVSNVNESFGVSVIEGMACEKAVIVSNVPGLKEVISNHGLIVEKDNVQQLAKAIIQLIESPELRISLGKAARKHVVENYEFDYCLEQLTRIYDAILDKKKTVEVRVKHAMKAEQI